MGMSPEMEELVALRRMYEEQNRMLMDLMTSQAMGTPPLSMEDNTLEQVAARNPAQTPRQQGFRQFSPAGPDPRSKKPTGKPGKYSPGGEQSQKFREGIREKNRKKKEAKEKSAANRKLAEEDLKRAKQRKISEANKGVAERNARMKKAAPNRIDY